MAVENLVTDPFLQRVLNTTTQTRQQCLALLDLIDEHEANGEVSDEVQLEISKQQKLMYAHLAQLRGLNRKAILSVRQTKQDTAEARSEIDRLHLQLQNLYYEQRHLRGEIHACESYE
jgi:THO complex subunit 5